MSDAARLFLASGNAHKIAELSELLDGLLAPGHVEIATPGDFPDVPEPEETGTTFEANAAIKAVYWARISGLLALADDSGLVVDALDGRPGVYSARYAESAAARNQRVLDELTGVPPERRTARFVCVAALADPTGRVILRRGEVQGRILDRPRGAGGFGYDPIFGIHEPGLPALAMAELDAAAKNAISHRGRALAAIAPTLAESLAAGRAVESHES